MLTRLYLIKDHRYSRYHTFVHTFYVLNPHGCYIEMGRWYQNSVASHRRLIGVTSWHLWVICLNSYKICSKTLLHFRITQQNHTTWYNSKATDSVQEAVGINPPINPISVMFAMLYLTFNPIIPSQIYVYLPVYIHAPLSRMSYYISTIKHLHCRISLSDINPYLCLSHSLGPFVLMKYRGFHYNIIIFYIVKCEVKT